MSAPILATKLYIPPPRPKIVPRPRLVERLNEELAAGCKLTLISASAGFGKTTLVSEWIANCGRQVAWLSLDERDCDSLRFLSYLVAALQTINPGIGRGLLAVLQSSEPPGAEAVLTNLLNEITTLPDNPSAGSGQGFILVLDDYHLVDSKPVDQAIAFLLEHQPPQMHLVIATREDPSLPLPRLRARGQCTELRAADLRFSPAEVAEFLNRVMRLNLSDGDVAALESRTEGWIAGLQMAALSMQGHPDASSFIQSFTGSHRFVLDYLLEEVLQRQPIAVQAFLLRTSILERLCSPLCEAVLKAPVNSGQETLEYIERANLFIIPLDNERRWYRYHHLFADLLRKRLGQSLAPEEITKLQIDASEWYENNGLILDAFRHAAAANDIERAVRLMESKKMPIHLRGAAMAILDWLESLPKTLLDARPALWWKQAAILLMIGQPMDVEEKLQAIETALASATLPNAELDDTNRRDLIGKIAAARANVAQVQGQTEIILVQARRALEYLHPNDLNNRSMAIRSLGFAYFSRGNITDASRAYTEALSLGQDSEDIINILLASIRLGQIQETVNQYTLASENYRRVLLRIDDYSPPNAPLAYLGLARIYYERNDINAAEQYGEQSLQLARQYDQVHDRLIQSELFLARLRLVRKDAVGAAHILSQAEQTARQKFTVDLPDVVAAQVLFHLHEGNTDAAFQLIQQYDLPVMLARVLIAQGDPSAALAVLEPQRQEIEAKGLVNRLLRVMVLQSIALYAHGEKEKALELLGEVLARTEPEGFIRLFVDEGPRMAELLSAAGAQGIRPGYVNKLLAAFAAEPKEQRPTASVPSSSMLVEPLTARELEVLRLIAAGLSNQEICVRLFLALDTVKGHNRRIFEKLQVQRRTEAIARARELGLL